MRCGVAAFTSRFKVDRCSACFKISTFIFVILSVLAELSFTILLSFNYIKFNDYWIF